MAQPCKVFTYTNVTTEKDALANIRRASESGGWTIDKDAIDADGELYLHSVGNGQQQLYFSLKLENAYDNPERFLLSVHGNTGFDGSAAWDAQPGRFTEKFACGYEYTAEKPLWLRNPGEKSVTFLGWWLVPPIAEQVVLVCPTFILTAIRVIYTFSDGKDTLYSGWVPLLFGAADGSENELNIVRWSAWSANAAMGLMLSGLYKLKNSSAYTPSAGGNSNYGSVGLLWNGNNAEYFPPKGDYGYTEGRAAKQVVLSTIISRPYIGTFSTNSISGTINVNKKNINYTYKGRTCSSIPCYNAAVLQNPFNLRHVLIKPLIYVATEEAVRIIGELPYYAVNMHGLKGKERIRIGGRVFMVFPDISDDDEIGLAVEVEA